MLLWGQNDVILVTMQHENAVQLQRQSNRQKMIVIPTLNHNVKVTLSSNVVLTSKQLSTAAWVFIPFLIHLRYVLGWDSFIGDKYCVFTLHMIWKITNGRYKLNNLYRKVKKSTYWSLVIFFIFVTLFYYNKCRSASTRAIEQRTGRRQRALCNCRHRNQYLQFKHLVPKEGITRVNRILGLPKIKPKLKCCKMQKILFLRVFEL